MSFGPPGPTRSDRFSPLPAIRPGEATGVSQHVRMDRRQAGALRAGRDQVIGSLTGERLAAFGDEEPGERSHDSPELCDKLGQTELVQADAFRLGFGEQGGMHGAGQAHADRAVGVGQEFAKVLDRRCRQTV